MGEATVREAPQEAQPAPDAAGSLEVTERSACELIRMLMRAMCDTPLYRRSRKLNGERGAALLAKMRTGSQTLSDLEDEHALWGYVNAVGSKRAFNVCEAFQAASQVPTIGAALRPERGHLLRVASLGGGPACCLLGWAAFERLSRGGDEACGGDGDGGEPSEGLAEAASTAALATSPPRLHVFDYAPGWASLVQRAADALAEPIGFAGCELTQALSHPANAALRAASAAGLDLVLLVYALHEADHDRPAIDASGRPPRWAALLLELWDAAAPATLFLVKDQAWVEQLAKALLESERPGTSESWVVPRAAGTRSAAHDSDGLFLLRT